LHTSGALLASLPLGLSQREATAQLQARGSLSALGAWLAELRSQGAWRGYCEWASSNIPGPALRRALQHQIIEAESRTLDPVEFVRVLVSAGVSSASAQQAMWLAQKTPQGEICIAEFLVNFGGPPPAEKKRRGMLSRFIGR